LLFNIVHVGLSKAHPENDGFLRLVSRNIANTSYNRFKNNDFISSTGLNSEIVSQLLFYIEKLAISSHVYMFRGNDM